MTLAAAILAWCMLAWPLGHYMLYRTVHSGNVRDTEIGELCVFSGVIGILIMAMGPLIFVVYTVVLFANVMVEQFRDNSVSLWLSARMLLLGALNIGYLFLFLIAVLSPNAETIFLTMENFPNLAYVILASTILVIAANIGIFYPLMQRITSRV